MKRFIPVLLSVCLLVGALAVPASAAEIDNDCFTNLLDFSTIKDEGSAFWTLQPNDAPIWLSLPYYSSPKRVEFTFRCSGGFTGSVGVAIGSANDPTSFTNLTVEKIDTYLYRAYGDISGAGYRMYIKFNVTSTAWLQLFNFNLMFTENNVFSAGGFAHLVTSSGEDNVLQYTPGSARPSYEWEPGADQASNDMTVSLYSTEWKKYDFLDFQLLIYAEPITSISCYLDSQIVPVTSQVIVGGSTDYEKYTLVSVRVDLRGLDRTSSSFPIVRIEGSEGPYGYSSIMIWSVCGIVEEAEVSFLTFWFNKISKGIDNIVNALSDRNGSDDLQNEVDNAGSELDNIGDVMDSVTRPDIGGVDTDITDEIGSDVDPSFITTFFQSDYVASIFSIVAVLATAGYVLYGKR